MQTRTRSTGHTVRWIVIGAIAALVSIVSYTVALTIDVNAAPITVDQTRQVQFVLISHGYVGVGPADGLYGPQTRHAVIKWQQANRLVADGIVGPVTMSSLLRSVGVTASQPAVRLDPPVQPAMSVVEIIREVWPDNLEAWAIGIAYRESRFQPHVRTWCCYGVFQIHRDHLARLGLTSVDQLYDPRTNIEAAYRLYLMDGRAPWTCC